ncbi:MAG: DUF1566 domain-containing protein [Candidatus Methylumidiphilus sp.]
MKALLKPLTPLVLLAGMGLVSTAEASLISRLGGLAVYDTDRNITWLANANANGQMTWATANSWAAGLNIGGYTGWRLPTADPTCGANYNCTNSELGHLYYTEGGLTQGQNITSSAYLAQFFTNMQNNSYWSGTEFAPNPNWAWFLETYNGYQNDDVKSTSLYAWAVHSGDVGGGGSVPEPGIIGLMGIGALAWAGTSQKRRG